MKSWKMLAFVLCAIFGANASTLLAQEKSAFASATIDLGVVVTDIEKAAKAAPGAVFDNSGRIAVPALEFWCSEVFMTKCSPTWNQLLKGCTLEIQQMNQ